MSQAAKFCATAFLLLAGGLWTWAAESSRAPAARTPVLVELFTSEGCSSCPPADAYLRTLDRQPVAGGEIIVLSEHVDYWNHIGWKDPYSARSYSARQGTYADRLDTDGVYTPQMVVDGTSEFVGNDSSLGAKAIAKAMHAPKVSVRLTSVSLEGSDTLKAHLETGTLDTPFGLREAEVYVAVALDHAESAVSRGENAGRRLAHTAVTTNITKVGTISQGQSFSQDITLTLLSEYSSSKLRLVAFLQEPGQGRVVGAAMKPVSNAVKQTKAN